MEINASSLIRHPRSRVYQAYRDELDRIIAYIPNIQAVNVLSRTDAPGRVSLHNEWIGRSEIPKGAQGLLKPEMLRWDDYAEWDEARQEVQWNLKIRVFTDRVRCSGTGGSGVGASYSIVPVAGSREPFRSVGWNLCPRAATVAVAWASCNGVTSR